MFDTSVMTGEDLFKTIRLETVRLYLSWLQHISPNKLVVQDPQISRHYLVLQNCSRWYIYTFSMIGNYNDSTLKTKRTYHISYMYILIRSQLRHWGSVLILMYCIGSSFITQNASTVFKTKFLLHVMHPTINTLNFDVMNSALYDPVSDITSFSLVHNHPDVLDVLL